MIARARRWVMVLCAALALSFVGSAAWADDPPPPPPCPDSDGDGYVVCDGVCAVPDGKSCGDCNDSRSDIHPGFDPDPIDGHGVDDNHNGQVDEGYGFCLFATDGPGDVCKTAGREVCVYPAGAVTAVNDGTTAYPGTFTCVLPPGKPLIEFHVESIAAGTCANGIDDDCDGDMDINDSACQQAEICDGVDNDGNGVVDNGFDVGAACDVGVGSCERHGVKVCNATHDGTVCSATPGTPKPESATVGNTCANGKDDNCDGKTDLADPLCAGFGAVELCNGVDDNGNGVVDEGFTTLGLPCSQGTGACQKSGTIVCKPDGTGTQCSATPGTPGVETAAAGTCNDFIDNDCDGLTDSADFDCAAAFSDIGVTCSLPFDDDDDHDNDDGHHRSGFVANNGGGSHDDDDDVDCKSRNIIKFTGGQATEVKADLLALNKDGSVLGIIKNVKNGEKLRIASRLKLDLDIDVDKHTGKKSYEVEAPVPLLRVIGKKNGVEDVAYCGILPYLEVTKPQGETISLSEGADLNYSSYLPLVDVNTFSLKLDGMDLLLALHINPMTAFPTAPGTALCTTAGACVFQVKAGCGDGRMVNVEMQNLRVEGLDTQLVSSAHRGIAFPNQVNTVSFTLKGLPPGGHIMLMKGRGLPVSSHLSHACYLDDTADTGASSSFGVSVTSPTDQEVVMTAPVRVTGVACGGNQIASLTINGKSVDVTVPTKQTCTTGNGITTASECSVKFAESLPQKDLGQAVAGNAVNGSFKRGPNRVVADATDVKGARTFNTDTVFALGPVQNPGGAPTALSLVKDAGLQKVANDVMAALTTEINPAFVVGLEEGAVQKFFNQKCQGAIDQFSERAQASLSGKTFGTFDVEPDCSCDLHVPIVLQNLTFTPFAATPSNPTCKVDFKPGQIDVLVHLPETRIEVGAHRSCTDHGIFGECIARTKVNVTAVTLVKDVSFAFTITENQIETKTPPATDSFLFDWQIFDVNGNNAFNSIGSCNAASTHPGRDCFGNKSDGTSDVCGGGGACVGAVKNPSYTPVTQNDTGIECWGADICSAFEFIGAILVDVFTFGLVDGFDLIGFLDFDFQFNQDFLDELQAAQPDAMGLDEVKVDEGKVQNAGYATFTPGPIDVTIQDGGLTAAFGATFEVTEVDPEIDVTPGSPLTPAAAPTVPQVVAAGDDISMLVADDVFNQIFAAMKISGKLKAVCNGGDSLTVGSLLPADCETLGPNNVAGAVIRGICHAVRGDVCTTLTGTSTLITNTKVGTCQGFSGGSCTGLNAAQKLICEGVPSRNIHAADGLMVCARQDMEPDFLIHEGSKAGSVSTDLILEDLNVVFALDRAHDGYTGRLEDLPGCFSAAGNAAPDCKFVAVCADLDLKTSMGINSASCTPGQAGFVFALQSVQPTSLDIGVLCSAATQTDDPNILSDALESIVVDAIANNSHAFMPPVCVDNLDLNGTLNFSSPDAKLFGLTTTGASGAGFADFLGITVGLNP